MAVATGEEVAVVWTMSEAGVVLLSLWHLMAAMMMTITMAIVIAAPPDPMMGILKLSMASRKEEVESSDDGSTVILLLAKTVSLKSSFSSFQCCSIICIRWLEKWTTCVSPDLIGIELQLMRVDWSEQARGRRSLVSAEMIHFVVLEGQISVTVRLLFRRKWKSSNKGSVEGVTVAFTEMWRVQERPTILTVLSKSFVLFERRELRDSKMYLDLSPNFGNNLPPSVITILRDLWLMTGTKMVFRTILCSHLAEEECVGMMKVVRVVMSAETRVF